MYTNVYCDWTSFSNSLLENSIKNNIAKSAQFYQSSKMAHIDDAIFYKILKFR